MQLKTILVKPTPNEDDVKVTRILWENLKTGELQSTSVNSLYLSLGPSMKSMQINVPPEMLPMMTKIQNMLGFGNMIGQIMWASAGESNFSVSTYSSVFSESKYFLKHYLASIVFMVRVDTSKVPEEGLRCLRDHIDGHNKHIIRLAEKDVQYGDKAYKYFVMQSTGGGHFPSKHTHAETALNVFRANIIPILGLDRKGIEYDILQVRSCARGVTAQNAFRMSAPASNMVMVYGLGGIGMSTMAGNALLMKAIMSQRQKVAENIIEGKDFRDSLKNSGTIGSIIHWNKPNPLNQNFAQFIDNVDNPKILAKKFGIQKKPLPMSSKLFNTFYKLQRVRV